MNISRTTGRKITFQPARQRNIMASLTGGAVAVAIGLLTLGQMNTDGALDQGTPVIMVEDTYSNQIVVDQPTIIQDIVLSTYDESMDGSGQLAMLNAVVAEHPNTPLAYHTRALFFAERGQSSEALNDFNTAIALDPSFADAYLNRAHLFVSMGEPGLASANYNQALALNPQLAEVYQYRGFVYYELGEFARAFEDYNQAILYHPTSDLYLMRGLAASNRDQTQASGLSDFYISMNTTSEDPAAQAAYYRGNSGSEGAIAGFTEAIRLDPNYVGAYNERAYEYMHMGNFDAALKDIAIAIALKPNNPIYYDSRCEFYIRAGEWSLGLADCETAESMGWYFSSYMQDLIRDARSHVQSR